LNTSPPADAPSLDDPVGDDVVVYRLIPVWQCKMVDGAWEFNSGAFDNASPEFEGDGTEDMSVVLGDHLAALNRLPEDLPEDTLWADLQWGVAALQVHFLRHEEDQEVLRTPREDEPAHGDVRGTKNTKRRRRLKKHAVWIVQPALPASA
jgi:hypothetical protein